MGSELLFQFDKNFNKTIIGTDEAGRGPAAGGVFAAAVCFEKVTESLIKDLEILNDSKKLTAKKRNSIYDVIKNNTLNEIVCVEVEEIEKINILNASLKAMSLACSQIIKTPDVMVLVDGNKLILRDIMGDEREVEGSILMVDLANSIVKLQCDWYD